MWVWVDRLGGMALDAALSATALLCLVSLAMLGCRQPARRVWLARAGIVGALAILPLASLSAWPRVNLIQIVRSLEVQTHPLFERDGTEIEAVPPSAELWRGLKSPPSLGIARLLTALYLAGVGAGIAGLVLGGWGLGWLRRRSVAPSEAAAALYRSLPTHGRRVRPSLRVSNRVRRPVLAGIVRPTILIPAALDQPEAAAALRLSLLHELAHAEHSDPAFVLAGNLAQAVWFFLPPLWWVRAQLRLDQEFLADRRAALALGPLASYASSLLGLAAPEAEPMGRSGGGSSSQGLPGSALVQRVLMLVRCPFPVELRPPAWWCWSLSLLVVLATLATSRVTLRAPAVPPPPLLSAAPQSFQMAWLVVPEQPANAHHRAPLVELPIRLPPHFELTVQVWGDSTTLPDTRIVGHRLGPSTGPQPDLSAPAVWHHVHLRRGPEGVRLTLDDQPVPTDPELDLITTWLSVEPPPGSPGRFRKLELRW